MILSALHLEEGGLWKRVLREYVEDSNDKVLIHKIDQKLLPDVHKHQCGDCGVSGRFTIAAAAAALIHV